MGKFIALDSAICTGADTAASIGLREQARNSGGATANVSNTQLLLRQSDSEVLVSLSSPSP